MKSPDQFQILVVDDHAANRYVKHRLLGRRGYTILEASTGQQALAMAQEHRPDLVLLDVRLPDMDGIAVCRLLKGAAAPDQPMVLQTSAKSIRTADRVVALEAGADGYLIEPAEPEEMLAVVRSLLRLRQAERELLEARRDAEAANAAKSHFLASASHDLRQPMQAQRLFFSALESLLTTDAQRRIATRLSESLTASESLLRVLMDVSALDACSIAPSMTSVDVSTILQRVVEDHRAEAEAKGLEMSLRLSPAQAWTDPVLLERIIRNLLSNAIRYTEHGRILAACRHRGGKVRVEIWDTGVGIAPQDIEVIFTDFYQVGNNERSRAKGLGLGLAVVARMAKLLDCQLAVRSQLGRGSMFGLSIAPLRTIDTITPTTSGQLDASLDALSVLIVEDDPEQMAGLHILLEGWGCQVTRAEAGDQPLRLLATGYRPDVILTDYRLPGPLTGLDLLEQFRRLSGGQFSGIVQTGDTEPGLSAAIRAQGHALLHKPYDAGQLRAALLRIQDDMRDERQVAEA